MRRHLWHTPKTYQNLLESENLICIATARTNITLGYGFNNLVAPFLQGIWHTFFQGG